MSINISEVFVVLVVALVVIKPENLPETAYTLGKWLKQLRQTTAAIWREIEEPLEKITSKQTLPKLPHQHITDEDSHG